MAKSSTPAADPRPAAPAGAASRSCLGVPLTAPGEGGVSRLGHVRRDAGPGQLLPDVPPAGAPLQREREVIPAGEPAPHRHGDIDRIRGDGRTGGESVARRLRCRQVSPDGRADPTACTRQAWESLGAGYPPGTARPPRSALNR